MANPSIVPMANPRLAQSEIRQAALLNFVLGAFEDIADTSQGLDQWLAALSVNLAAKTVDVNIDYICVGLDPHSPHLGQQHGTGNDSAGRGGKDIPAGRTPAD